MATKAHAFQDYPEGHPLHGTCQHCGMQSHGDSRPDPNTKYGFNVATYVNEWYVPLTAFPAPQQLSFATVIH